MTAMINRRPDNKSIIQSTHYMEDEKDKYAGYFEEFINYYIIHYNINVFTKTFY